MSDQDPGVVSPGLAPLQVETAQEYVSGFPVHVAATIRASSPEAGLRNLPYADLFRSAGAFGLTLTDLSGKLTIVSAPPSSVVDREKQAGTLVLRPGESRRMLIDLSEMLPAGIKAGEYRAVLAYGETRSRTNSPQFVLRFRDPSAEERADWKALDPEAQSLGGWGMWSLHRPAEKLSPDTPIPPTAALRFNRAVRLLLFGDRLDAKVLQGLDGIYAPEVAALAAEVLQVAGDQAGYERQSQSVRARYPSLSWWIDQVAAGQGLIAFYRSRQQR